MSDFEIRSLLTILLALILLIMLLSRLRLFMTARIVGRRARYDYEIGYLTMAIGAFWCAVDVISGFVLTWGGLMIFFGLEVILWNTLNEWSETSMPPWTTTDKPTLKERILNFGRVKNHD